MTFLNIENNKAKILLKRYDSDNQGFMTLTNVYL